MEKKEENTRKKTKKTKIFEILDVNTSLKDYCVRGGFLDDTIPLCRSLDVRRFVLKV